MGFILELFLKLLILVLFVYSYASGDTHSMLFFGILLISMEQQEK